MMTAPVHVPPMAVGSDPEILPLMFDLTLDQVLLARIPLQTQAETSFLDERALSPGVRTEWMAWPAFRDAAAKAPDPSLAYILHVSHCGSTLISRLVQMASGARSLREPLPLRSFAIEAVQSLDGGSFFTRQERVERIALFEKAWACGQTTVIKATSICNDIADDLHPRAALAFIYLKPQIFLANLLGRPQAQADLRAYGQLRLKRWNARSGWPQRMCDLKRGELAALCWLAEMTSIMAAQRPVHTLDFDVFLTQPEERLLQLCESLNRPATPAQASAAVASPVMRHYSKNPSRAYDAATRAQILSQSQTIAADDIRDGMAWLNAAARNWKTAETALSRFG